MLLFMLFACFIAFRPIVHAKVEREKNLVR